MTTGVSSRFLKRRYYDKAWLREHSPSRRDNLSYEKEEEYRQAYCQLLLDMGQKFGVYVAVLKLTPSALAVQPGVLNGATLVQIIAQAAFFLAGKVEEESRDLGAVIRAFWEHLHRQRAGTPDETRRLARQQMQDERFLEAYKQKVLTGERALLLALSFDLAPCQQHCALAPLFEECSWIGTGPHGGPNCSMGASGRILTQAAWNFLNDSLKTTVSLQASADEIACGVMLLCARVFGVEETLTQPDGHTIWSRRGIDPQKLEAVIEEVLSVYDAPDQVLAVARGLAPAGSHDAAHDAAAMPLTAARHDAPDVKMDFLRNEGGDVKPEVFRQDALGFQQQALAAELSSPVPPVPHLTPPGVGEGPERSHAYQQSNAQL